MCSLFDVILEVIFAPERHVEEFIDYKQSLIASLLWIANGVMNLLHAVTSSIARILMTSSSNRRLLIACLGCVLRACKPRRVANV